MTITETNLNLMAHLMRRAGFGADRDELEQERLIRREFRFLFVANLHVVAPHLQSRRFGRDRVFLSRLGGAPPSRHSFYRPLSFRPLVANGCEG